MYICYIVTIISVGFKKFPSYLDALTIKALSLINLLSQVRAACLTTLDLVVYSLQQPIVLLPEFVFCSGF